MCLLNSYCVYIIMFHALSVISSPIEGNSGLDSEPGMKRLVSRTIDLPENEDVSRTSENVENNNHQSNPPQLITAVEFQIIRELQKMVKFNVNGSVEAANALDEIESAMKNGMPFTDAVREGLRILFPDVIDQQNSTSDEDSTLTIILFTNAKKYMQDMYILNLLRQQFKENGYSTESLNSSTDRNLQTAGNRQSSQNLTPSKPATVVENTENGVNELVKYTNTREKNLSTVRKNNSSQSSVLQLATSTPKTEFSQEETDSTTPPHTSLKNKDLFKNELSLQQRNVSSQPATPQLSSYTSRSQSKQTQSNFSSSSTTRQLSSSAAPENQPGLQQSKLTQDMADENTLRSTTSEPSRKPQKEITPQIVANSNISSDLTELSQTMNKWVSRVKKPQQPYQATNEDKSSLTFLKKREDSNFDVKKEQKLPVSVDDEKLLSEKPSLQNKVKISGQDQQMEDSNIAAFGTSSSAIKIKEKSQLSREKAAKENMGGPSNVMNKKILSVQESLQQHQAPNDDNSSVTVLKRRQDSDYDMKKEQRLPVSVNDEELRTENSSLQNKVKISGQGRKVEDLYTSAFGSSSQEEQSEFSGGKIAKKNISSPSNAKNKKVLNAQESLQQYQSTSDDGLSVKTIEENSDNIADLDEEERIFSPVDNGRRNLEKSQNTLKMSNLDQQLNNHIALPGGPTNKVKMVTEKSQFLEDEKTKANFIKSGQPNQRISRPEQVEAKPSLNQSPKVKNELKNVQSSPDNNSSSMKITEIERSSKNNMPRIIEKPASSGNLGSQIRQYKESGVLEEISEQSTLEDEVKNVDQEQDLKKLMLKLKEMNQFGVGNLPTDHLDRTKLSSQQSIYRQVETVEHGDLMNGENLYSQETKPVKNIYSKAQKIPILRTETPSVRTRTVILNKSEPAKKTIQYRDEEYKEEKYSEGYPSLYGGRNDLGEEVYRKSIGSEYEEMRGTDEYGINKGYEGMRKNNIQEQQWSNNGAITSRRTNVSGSFFESKNGPSQLLLPGKSTAALAHPKLAEQLGINLSENGGSIITTREEQMRSINNGEITDTLVQSVSQPENQKWQRRVLKIVEKSDPSGKIIRKVSKSGDWPSNIDPLSFARSALSQETSYDEPFVQQYPPTVGRLNFARSAVRIL